MSSLTIEGKEVKNDKAQSKYFNQSNHLSVTREDG